MKKKYILIMVLIFVIMATIIFTLLPGKQQQRQINYESIPSNSFNEFIKDNQDAIIIDVRTPMEFLSGNIDGSINIDFYKEDFKDKLSKLDKDKKYLIYCRSGSRSKQTLTIMEELGFKNVYELNQGISGCC